VTRVHDVDHGRYLGDLGGHIRDIVQHPGDAADRQRFLSVQGWIALVMIQSLLAFRVFPSQSNKKLPSNTLRGG
jgi:hypothetical protein